MVSSNPPSNAKVITEFLQETMPSIQLVHPEIMKKLAIYQKISNCSCSAIALTLWPQQILVHCSRKEWFVKLWVLYYLMMNVNYPNMHDFVCCGSENTYSSAPTLKIGGNDISKMIPSDSSKFSANPKKHQKIYQQFYHAAISLTIKFQSQRNERK